MTLLSLYTVDWFSTILLIGLVQGAILFVGMIVKTYGKKNRNAPFTALIFVVSIALLSKLLFNQDRYQVFPQAWFLADGLAYFIGPLWYFTLRTSTYPNLKLRRTDWLLMLPVTYYVAFLIYIFLIDRENFLLWSIQPGFANSFYAFIVTVFVTNLTFWFRALTIVKKFRETNFPILFRKGQSVILGLILLWLACLGMSLVSYPQMNMEVYNVAFGFMALLLLSLTLLAVIKPSLLAFLTQTFDFNEVWMLKKLGNEILEHLQSERPFLDKNFSLHKLAAQLGTNSSLASKAINTALNTSFSDLINKLRVEHFLMLAKSEDQQNLTHWALAQESGFGNKVSFHKSFKKNLGQTPKAYLAS